MSHVIATSCVITERDLPALKLAAEALGLRFNEGQTTHKWYGTWVNDYSRADAAYRQGIDPKDYGRCDHAISLPDNDGAYEVGVVKAEDGTYRLAYDFFAGGRGMSKFVGSGLEKLTQEFGVQKAKALAQEFGFQVQSVGAHQSGKQEVVCSVAPRKYF